MNSRKHIGIVLAVFVAVALAAVAIADSVTAKASSSLTATGYSAAIPASGYLERIEVVRDNSVAGWTNQNSTVILATYDGTNALETFYTVTFAADELRKVARPRVVGTTTAGVALEAIRLGGDTSNVVQVLTVPYERFMIGGNLKIATQGDATNSTVTATIYFDRGR